MPLSFIISILLAGFTVLGAAPFPEGSRRCGCIPPSSRGLTFEQGVAKSRARADVVFRGRVVRADPFPAAMPGRFPTRVGASTGVARVVVSAVWKGELGDTVVMALSRGTSCGWWPREGTEHVVFATRGQRGVLHTRQCTGTVGIARADSTLAALGPPLRVVAP